MKYSPGSEYSFECCVTTGGINASSVEVEIKKVVQSFIKKNVVKSAVVGSECIDKKVRTSNLLLVLEELQTLVGGKIIHIGRLPVNWVNEIKNEMKEKQELDAKREMFLDDCVAICVDCNGTTRAAIINRKGIYSISENIK